MVKKQAGKQVSATAAKSPRVRKPTKKQLKITTKKQLQQRSALASSFRLSAQVFTIFKRFYKPLGGILLVYLLLNIIFASGIGNLGDTVHTIKNNLNNQGTQAHPLITGLSGFGALLGSGGAVNSAIGSTLQALLFVIGSLVIIWSLRQLLAGKTVTVKQAYYSAMTPLIPFLAVVFFIILELMPITFGSVLLTSVATSLGTVSGLWTFLFGIIFCLLAAWSIYMLAGSIFALYIVTLPDMHPRAALRSAKKLVKFRRWQILRRVLFLPLILLSITGAIIIPLILYATFLVAPVFYLLGMLAILFTHSYLYSLYKGLLE